MSSNKRLFTGCLALLLGIVLFITFISSNDILAIFILFICFIISGFFVLSGQIKEDKDNGDNKKKQELERIEALNFFEDKIFNIYKNVTQDIIIPVNTYPIKPLLYNNCICWKADNNLFIISSLVNIKNYMDTLSLENLRKFMGYEFLIFNKVIPITQIEYFSLEGEIFMETKITGGGGGGSSITGAVVGGLIAGGAGAIVGSRKGITPISSQIIKHDNRETELKYYDDENNLQTLMFSYESYEIFKLLIPEKEYRFIISKKTIKNNMFENSENIKDKIRKLNELKVEGLITEDEYNNQKAILLNKL